MTKTLATRAWMVGAVLLALTFFAARAGGSESSVTAVGSIAERPVAAGLAADAAQPAQAAARQVQQAQRTVAVQDGDGSVTMTLLHNNDGESKLLPNIEAGFPGIARFATTWVDLGRNSDADILLRVSSGDNFLASKEFAVGLAREDQPLYDSIALRGLYEVMGLGNHDFDFGPDVTARFIEGFRLNETSDPVTFVAANIDISNEPALQALADVGRIAPSSIHTDPASGLKVGVIGALTPRLPNISSPRDVIVDADVAGAVNAEAAALIEQGIDRIILVSHLQGLGEDRELVPQLSGIDIVVAGGGDELLKNDGDTCQAEEGAVAPYPMVLTDADGNEVPVVTAPGGYRCIGRLEVTFDSNGAVTSYEGGSIGVPLDGDAEEFAMARVEEPLAEALTELDAMVIGQSDVVLDGRRNSVRTSASNVGELLADSLLSAGQAAPDFGGQVPVAAIQNGGGIRNDAVIPPGDITEADTFDIAPFANFVVTGQVPRERFKDMLEVAVAGLPDAEGIFPQIAGFSMTIDESQPGRQVNSDGDCSLQGDAGSRVRNVVLDDGTEIVSEGQVVAGDDVVLATIDFLAGGGDCYPLADLDFTNIGVSYQQALSSFITDDLDGNISESGYPVGGGRTSISGTSASTDSIETDGDARDDADDAEDTETADAGSDADSALDTGAETTDELPNTGLNSWLFVIIAITVACAGILIFVEAKRTGWLSLTNRLSATRAWFPTDDE